MTQHRGGVRATNYVLHIDIPFGNLGAMLKTICGRRAHAVNRSEKPEREPREALCKACASRAHLYGIKVQSAAPAREPKGGV